MFLGYNTNGLAHHDLFDAVELLSEIGYCGVAITIDHGALPPGDPNFQEQIDRLRRLLEKHEMRSVIETGARFLLDPRAKHEPTLLSLSSQKRIEFYRHAIDCAARLGSDCVSIWSGRLPETLFVPESSRSQGTRHSDRSEESPGIRDSTEILRCDQNDDGFPARKKLAPEAMDRLVAGLRETLDYAERQNVIIAFEPEPGMFIDTTGAFDELSSRIDSPNFRLTLDIGHLHCQGEPIVETIRRHASRLANVHIEDMRRGRHEHLMFGEGEIDFPPVLQALSEAGYAGGVYVELSRHSHEGPTAARGAFEFLTNMIKDEG